MHLFTEAAFGTDGEAITHDEHAHHQLGIDRGTANRAIERLQLLPNIAQIKEAVDPAQQMIVRNVILKAEVVEQPLRYCLHPHHRSALRANHLEHGITHLDADQPRLNQHNLPMPTSKGPAAN